LDVSTPVPGLSEQQRWRKREREQTVGSDGVCGGGGVSSKENEREEFSGGEQWRRRVSVDRWIKEVGGIEGQR